MMLLAVVLICSMNTDPSACDLHTALDVITTARVNSPMQCGFMGQAMLASTTLVPDPTKQYMKIVCVRDQTASSK